MKNSSEKYKLLITRKLAREATNSEEEELNVWLEASEQNRELFREYERIWEHSPINQHKIEVNKKSAWEKINQKIDSYEKNTLPSKAKVIPLLHKSKIQFYAISGIAAMLILIAGVYFMLLQKPQNQLMSYEHSKETTTDPFILSDGTSVFFNGKASLNYPAEFSGNHRKVSLTGNAFFDVATLKDYPFIIELDGARVVVPGTSFNIIQDPATGNIELAVLSGRVILETDSGNSIALTTDEKAYWRPQSLSLTKEKIVNYNFMAWKTGKLEFTETGLDEVFKDLQQAYYINITWPPGLSDKKLTARFWDENPEDIFNTIEILFDVEIEKQENVYIVKN
ncbi:MAG: DUF4974 domain-containing protein [Bacteroidetes bacterium]|nr:MAG: DUF4974 domain-containing protein [Bacteroidota bacterium]